MQFDFYSFIEMLWQRKPSILILFVAGLIVFVLLVVDAHRFQKRYKAQHRMDQHSSASDFRAQLCPCSQRWPRNVRRSPEILRLPESSPGC